MGDTRSKRVDDKEANKSDVQEKQSEKGSRVVERDRSEENCRWTENQAHCFGLFDTLKKNCNFKTLYSVFGLLYYRFCCWFCLNASHFCSVLLSFYDRWFQFLLRFLHPVALEQFNSIEKCSIVLRFGIARPINKPFNRLNAWLIV